MRIEDYKGKARNLAKARLVRAIECLEGGSSRIQSSDVPGSEPDVGVPLRNPGKGAKRWPNVNLRSACSAVAAVARK